MIGCTPVVAVVPVVLSVFFLGRGMFVIPVNMLSKGAGIGELLGDRQGIDFVTRHWPDFRTDIIITTLAFLVIVLLILARVALAKVFVFFSPSKFISLVDTVQVI